MYEFFFGKKSACSHCDKQLPESAARFYCCNKEKTVCSKCSTRVCPVCGKTRTQRTNITCVLCHKHFDEKETFYDFRIDCSYCIKCLSKYYHFYVKQLKEETVPEDTEVEMSNGSFVTLREMIDFFSTRCWACLRAVRESQAFEMIHGVIVCIRCLQANPEQQMTRLLVCVECKGHLHSRKEIALKINAKEGVCNYCQQHQNEKLKESQKQAEMHKKQSLELAKKSSIQLLKKQSLFLPALQMSKLRSGGLGSEELAKLISSNLNSKMSTMSMEEQQNFPLKISPLKRGQFCHYCMVCLPKNRLLTVQSHPMCPLCYQERTYDSKLLPQPEFKQETTKTREQQAEEEPLEIILKLRPSFQGASTLSSKFVK